MQIAAQIEEAPATARECRGHKGNHFVPVTSGDGLWRYYWLSSRQARFWRCRSETEKGAIVGGHGQECFVCRVQRAMEAEAVMEDRLYRALMTSLLVNPKRSSKVR